MEELIQNMEEHQIRAYAAAFREGDAVLVGGGAWHEVIKADEIPNADVGHIVKLGGRYALNYMVEEEGSGIAEGFFCDRWVDRYKVATLSDYEVRGGEKLVWLCESNDTFTFGEAYNLIRGTHQDCYECVRDDDGRIQIAQGGCWGVIPKFKNLVNVWVRRTVPTNTAKTITQEG